MAEAASKRLKQAATDLNVGTHTIVDFLAGKGISIENKPTTKLSPDQVALLNKEFASSAQDKAEAAKRGQTLRHTELEQASQAKEAERAKAAAAAAVAKPAEPVKPVAAAPAPAPAAPAPQPAPAAAPENGRTVPGLKVLGKIELDAKGRPVPPRPAQPAPAPAAEAPKPAPVPEVKSTPAAPAAAAPEAPKPAPAPVEAPAPRPEPTPAPAAEVKPVPVPEQPKPAPAPVAETRPAAPTPAPAPAAKPAEPVQAAAPAAPVAAPVAEAKPADGGADAGATDGGDQGTIVARGEQLKGLTVLGKIELPVDASRRGGGGGRGARPVASSDVRKAGIGDKKKRQRIAVPGSGPQGQGGPGGPQGNRPSAPGTGNDRPVRPANQNRPGGGPGRPGDNRGPRPNAAPGTPEQNDKQIQDQIKATLAKLSGGRGNQQNRAKYRRDKRAGIAEATEMQRQQNELASKTLKLTEFISANDLASLMNVSVNEVIKVCLNMGMFVSINQRLDAEAITVIADEFGYDVEFLSAEDEQEVVIDADENPDLLQDRAPIVTIMGHVDHGKTSLLDYIRNAQVAKGEAGGITQHIGAYEVKTESGKRITFLDTPGHEAFTAMRARGAKVTDIAIIVVAADDSVMPQTKEAINHAQAAGVPIVIALNKIDKPGANPDKVREELSAINILVEEWGGKYQSQEVSAKTGAGIDDLLEKVLLEAELLELKANPDRRAVGSVIEASLDKGRGYVTTILVQTGTLEVGDIVLAGPHYGRVKAMTDHRGKKMKSAGPSTPVQLLGLQGAPQAGDKVVVMETEREAREIATQRLQLQREQSMRTKKHITLDEIGRRLAIGSFKELNIIVKGDVDGSVEALSDSLLKLSTPEVAVNILSKGVGAISESDVLLASASDAIIIGFQVRPSLGARKLAEQEQIDVRLYSIIYNAINEVKDAMEGMLAPTVQEVTVATIEVRQVFNITKVGTIAGCMVTDGSLHRNTKVRVVRDGIVQYTGDVQALKRFKDDVSEVRQGYECGISIKGFNDIQEGDIIEGFEEKEVKRTL
ncbi:translation initiation factor IF-2 [Hymenobacter busanensis]|uniref:Translation initiation factor IF-2 n=1 Tax=Hymenobacter busanensis TaxID=2607656 RepID=A0A7L4ZX15_9BACT|nr:translation initiation factor IF-2 [Hymenobacter busanensis]KAA9325594.1 translation initiation factor IF-2 [Hymenobacter busanensis]QHJ07778.1 translation initiation factor IF-2 [Hymenobacter busanensis]